MEQAYLNCTLRYPIWMKLPNGLRPFGPDIHYVRLLKTLYGLRQGANSWYEEQRQYMLGYDKRFLQSDIEPCVYFIIEWPFVFIVWMQTDDYVIATNDDAYRADFVAAWHKQYGVQDNGAVREVLQASITVTKQYVDIGQQRLIEDMARRYGIAEGTKKFTPMSEKLDLLKPVHHKADVPLSSLVMAIFWIARVSRPDVLSAASYLSQFCSCCDDTHWTAALRVLRYLLNTKRDVLRLRPTIPGPDVHIEQYSDASYARYAVDRRSYSGSLTFVNGALVDYGSHKQTTTATAPNIAEYDALCDAGKDALHAKHWFESLLTYATARDGHQLPRIITPIPIFGDNTGAAKMSEQRINNRAFRHVEIRVHAIRDWIERQWVRTARVAGRRNPADAMTKPLSREDFAWFRERIGMFTPPNAYLDDSKTRSEADAKRLENVPLKER